MQKYGLRFQEISGIACDIKVTGAPTRLPSATEIAIYRLVEEALNNVAAHSNAKSATVLIDHAGAMLSIAVQDDGQGFDYVKWKTGPNGKHLGLVGMQERVESLAGEMQVWSELGQGTCVTFHLPIAMESVR